MPEPYRVYNSLATGTVTLLLSDIEGSIAPWEQDGARMSQALAAHDALARSAVEHCHGTLVKMTGDASHAVFDDAPLLSPTERSHYEQRGAAARAGVADDAAFALARQEGRALTLQQAIELGIGGDSRAL